MSDKKNLFELLNENTSEAGTWTLNMNEHKSCYVKGRENIIEHYFADKEDFKDISTDLPIYKLLWYNKTPVGRYTLYANSLEQMYDKVFEICKELKGWV